MTNSLASGAPLKGKRLDQLIKLQSEQPNLTLRPLFIIIITRISSTLDACIFWLTHLYVQRYGKVIKVHDRKDNRLISLTNNKIT